MTTPRLELTPLQTQILLNVKLHPESLNHLALMLDSNHISVNNLWVNSKSNLCRALKHLRNLGWIHPTEFMLTTEGIEKLRVTLTSYAEMVQVGKEKGIL